VKRENRDASAGRQAERQRAQQRVERGEFVVNRYTERLNVRRIDASTSRFPALIRIQDGGADASNQIVCRRDGLPLQGLGDGLCVWLVGVLLKQSRELLRGQVRD
jgi:hypothetical protein